MNRDETKEILMTMQAVYPNWKPESLTVTVNAWETMLKDYPKQVVEAALNTYIATSESAFAPSVSQLIGIIRTANTKPLAIVTSQEAWDLVCKASQNASYHAEEEFEKLPPLVKKAVGSASNLREMALMDISAMQTVEKSTFKRTYDALVQRQEEYEKIPARVRDLIQNTTQNILEG